MKLYSYVPASTLLQLSAAHPFKEAPSNKNSPSITEKKKPDRLLPSKVEESLTESQRKAVWFGVEQGGRIILGDDMGMGKSLQALAIAWIFKEDWPLFIVCPDSQVNNIIIEFILIYFVCLV
jgi:SNF2 family DNA or RNA helicase